MKNQLTLTVDTTNVLVLNEAADMLKRIANANCPVMVAQEPVVAPTPPAPVAVVTPTPPAPCVVTPAQAFEAPQSEIELDSAGMPWDERIHASTRSKVKDGTWTFRRSLDEAIKVAVMAEYGTVVEPTPSTDEAESDFVPEPEEDVMGIMGTPAPVAPIPAPPAPVAPIPAPPASVAPLGGSNITTFLELMPAVRKAGLPQADILAACQALGLPNLIALNWQGNEHLIPELATLLGL